MVNARFVAALSFAALTFVLGIMLGQFISESSLSEAKNSQNKLMSNLIGYELSYSLLSETDYCKTDFSELQKERAKLGRRVSDLEERLGPNNPEVLTQIELYHTYQIREYMLLKKIKEYCDKPYPMIFYFYTNNNDLCIAQGQTLDALQLKYNLTTIYAINYDIDNPSVNVLKKIYNVTSTPTLVINEKVYPEFLRIEKIEELIGNKSGT